MSEYYKSLKILGNPVREKLCNLSESIYIKIVGLRNLSSVIGFDIKIDGWGMSRISITKSESPDPEHFMYQLNQFIESEDFSKDSLDATTQEVAVVSLQGTINDMLPVLDTLDTIVRLNGIRQAAKG